MVERPACPECDASDVKRYPQEFPDAEWTPGPLAGGGALRYLSGGPSRSPQLYVCMGCGHNFERR